jgi:hypothetical protein
LAIQGSLARPVQPALLDDRVMKNRPSQASRTPRQQPLDHLRRGEHRASDDEREPTPPPDATNSDAARGKDTRSPAAVGTRDHLEGAEQGPM